MAKTRPRFQTESIIKTWPMVRLGDVCTIEFGTRVRRKDSQGGDYPVYGGGGATFCWSTYNREDQCIVSRFAMSEECVRFVKGKFFLNDSGLSVRSDNQDLSQTYLDWVLYSKQPEIYALGRGAAQKNLDVEQFVDMMLPLPPLSVQREIVARLERELAAVEKMKKGFEALAETARAGFKAELKEVFEEISRGGAETRRLGEICELKVGGDKPKDFSKTQTQTHKVPVVSNGIEDDGICGFSSIATIGEPCVTVSARGTIGWACVRDYPFVPIVRLIVATPTAVIDVRYLLYVFKRLPIGYAGSSIPQLTVPMIKDMEIPVPPLSNQREVVERLDSAKARTEKLEAKAREGVAVCETMRKAILKEAFECSVREEGPYG